MDRRIPDDDTKGRTLKASLIEAIIDIAYQDRPLLSRRMVEFLVRHVCGLVVRAPRSRARPRPNARARSSRMPSGSRATAARSHSSRKARRHCPAMSEARYLFGSRERILATAGDSCRCDLDGDRTFLAGFCNANFAARRRRDCADSITAFWTSLTFCQRRRWPSLIARRPPALNVGMIGPPYAVDADPGSLRRIWRRIWGLLVTLTAVVLAFAVLHIWPLRPAAAMESPSSFR